MSDFAVHKRIGAVLLNGITYTRVRTLCGFDVEVRHASDHDELVTCVRCLKTIVAELRTKLDRLEAKVRTHDS